MDDVSAMLAVLRRRDHPGAEDAARSLRKLAEREPHALIPHAAEVLKLAMAEQDLRVRWNLIQVLGKIPLKPVQRGVAVDWLFERLRDASPFTRTFALQALYDLSCEDESLRGRWKLVAREFAENGTAAMRARARKLLKANGDSS
jgi:hypothetical protein